MNKSPKLKWLNHGNKYKTAVIAAGINTKGGPSSGYIIKALGKGHFVAEM